MTKKEVKILEDIRNQFTPILNYFKMKEDIDNSEIRPEQKDDLYKLIKSEDEKAAKSSKIVKKLLDSFG